MKKLTEERLSVLVSILLGIGAGWSLSSHTAAVEIKQWLIGISIIFSLLISLLVSAFYKNNRRKIRKSKLWKYAIVSAAMFITMLLAFYISYSTFETRLNVNVLTIDNKTETVDSIFVKGLYFTSDAKNEIKKIRANNPTAQIDLRIIFNDNGNDIDNVWTKTSRTYSKLIILLSYIFFISSLAASITLTTEILKEDKIKSNDISSPMYVPPAPQRIEIASSQHAFICHSSVDAEVANTLVSRLENAGIKCWIAPRNIPSGATYAASIIQGIRNSNLFIFVFTIASNKSEAVVNEIENANAQKIRIIPFKIDNIEYADSLEYYLRSKQSINTFNRPVNEAIDNLIESIKTS